MPRFYIHILNGNGLQDDEDGQEFLDARLAVAEAGKTAGELLHDETLADGGEHRVELNIVDDAGTQVGCVRASISLGGKLD